jgi:hypothetical protein
MSNRRVGLLSLFVLLAGCGGGGSADMPSPVSGSGSAPGPSPTPQADTLSGRIASSSGFPVVGAQVTLAGSIVGSTVTSASGTYTFSNLSSGSFTVEPRANGLTFLPATREISVTTDAGSQADFSATFQSSGLVSTFMTSAHALGRSTFATQESTLSANLAAVGQFKSGNHYSRSVSENLLPSVESFINSAIQYIQNTGLSYPIDKRSIENLFRQYSSTDIEFSRTYYSSVDWGLSVNSSGLDQVLADVRSQVEQRYSNVIAKFA